MKKNIAIIASLDTKETEVLFLIKIFRRSGHEVFIIDIGVEKSSLVNSQINAIDIAKEVGHVWISPRDIPKHEMIDILKSGVSKLIPKLYSKGLFDAIISIGGLQNTTVAVGAMKTLPIGFPKVMVSTVASGKRSFDTIVGHLDIIVIPSIADFSGSNIITDTVLRNAAAAVIGIVENAGKPLNPPAGNLIGISTMGVVDKGSSNLIKKLKKKGYQVVSFHTTGVGGKILDELVEQEVITATIEFSLHEIVGELFGGYSSGAINRLVNSSKKGIPQFIIPGACDFLDLDTLGLGKDMLERKHIYHNSDLIHLKLLKREIVKVGELIAERLNESSGPVTIILPLEGVRSGTGKGESLYDPDIDQALTNTLKAKLNDSIKIIEVDANINDNKFSLLVLGEIEKLLPLN